MSFYEIGVGVAVVLWACTTAGALVVLNSRLERNLNKIGYRLSWVTLRLKKILPGEAGHSRFRKLLKFVILCGMGLSLVLGSWVYVVYVVALIVRRKLRQSETPRAVWDLRRTLQSRDLSVDELAGELALVAEKDLGELECIKAIAQRKREQPSVHPTSRG